MSSLLWVHGHWTYLGVSLAVEVGHVPAVLLVIVVVGVCGVVRGGDRLRIRSRGTVVEIHTTAK